MTRTVFDNTNDLRSKHGKLSRPNAIQQSQRGVWRKLKVCSDRKIQTLFHM